MSTNVFANGKEVAARKSDNQSIAMMPDVCLSPPSPPAGPIPIPYPNFSAASDMADGTKTVKISGDEVGMKDQSNYKTSKGDEAATKSFGMGVVTAGIQGKTFFAAWSSDVMFEGANAVRFMDMTTGNHGSQANSADTGVSTGTPAVSPEPQKNCEELQEDNEKAAKTPPGPSPSQLSERTTLTTGQYKAPGGGFTSVKAFSRQLVGKAGWSKGVGPGNSSKLGGCSGGFDYQRKNFMPHSSHTEARIIEDLFQGPPAGGPPGSLGVLTMRIQWNRASGKDPNPCANCSDLICSAIDCGLEIHICSDDDVKNKTNGTPHQC